MEQLGGCTEVRAKQRELRPLAVWTAGVRAEYGLPAGAAVNRGLVLVLPWFFFERSHLNRH